MIEERLTQYPNCCLIIMPFLASATHQVASALSDSFPLPSSLPIIQPAKSRTKDRFILRNRLLIVNIYIDIYFRKQKLFILLRDSRNRECCGTGTKTESDPMRDQTLQKQSRKDKVRLCLVAEKVDRKTKL